MRMEFEHDDAARRASTRSPSAFGMEWRVRATPTRRSAWRSSSRREEHCLLDLLWRRRSGELHCDDRRRDLQPRGRARRRRGVRRRRSCTCRTRRDAQARPRRRCSSALAGRFDLVVLARYMQILSGDFLERVGRAGHQHPPLVPAGVRRRGAVRARARARREDHRRDRALRHRGARRRADHRAGRRARHARRRRRGAAADRAATSSARCSPARSAGTSRTASWSTAAARSCSSRPSGAPPLRKVDSRHGDGAQAREDTAGRARGRRSSDYERRLRRR